MKLEALSRVLGITFDFGTSYPEAGPPEIPSLAGEPDDHHRQLPWLVDAWRAEQVPIAFTQDFLDQLRVPIERLRAVQPSGPGATSSPLDLAVIEVPSPRAGPPCLWCCLDGRRLILVKLQFEAELILVFDPPPAGAVRVLQANDTRFRPLGRVVWQSHYCIAA